VSLFKRFSGKWGIAAAEDATGVSSNEGGKSLLLLSRNGQCSALGGELAVRPALHTGTLLRVERPAAGRG